MSTANPSRPTGRSFRLVCPPEQMPQVESLLRAQGYEFEPETFSPFCRRLLCEPRPLGSSLAAFFGYIYIQDRSSMLPPLALAPRQGEAVLDMCASPGSKTGFLGQLTGPDGFVLGNELSRARLATLAGLAPLGEQFLRMIGILDILPPIVAADMASDELVLVVYAHPIRVSLQRHALTRQLGRHRIVVGVERDTELL